jgi:hypothetical protein
MYISGKGKTLLQQKFKIEKEFPFIECSVFKNKLTCKGKFESSFSGRIYDVEIIKIGENKPEAFIKNPRVKKKHIYPDGSLCFYHIKNFRWKDHFWMTEYTIPWVSSWIYFYEIWLLTDIWFADEAEHGDEQKTNSE